MKTNKSTASKSTELTDAPKSIVSTIKPQIIMQPDNSINSTPTINAGKQVTTLSTALLLLTQTIWFVNEQTATEATAVTDTTEPPKQQRVGKQQRKSDYADFKATYLTPAKLRSVTRSTSRTAYGRSSNASPASSVTVTPPSAATSTAVLLEHLNLYADDIEIWRKL